MSEVDRRILGDAPTGTELERWAAEGERRDYSNIISWVSPDEKYLLEITLDDPVAGFLLRLFDLTQGEPRSGEGGRISQTVINKMADADRVLSQAAQVAAAADELRAVDADPMFGPEYPDMEDVERDDLTVAPPEEWSDQEDVWDQKVQDAFGEMGHGFGRPALTTKEIDGKDYYYLQRRSGDSVETQYVAPVDP